MPLAKVALGTNSNCGIGTDGMAVCWADGYLSPSSVAPSIAFSAIATGTLHHCGIKSDDDSVVCWGDRAEQPPPGPFMAVDGKTDFLCGLTDIGVECWGRNPLPSVEGSWDALTVGNEHACAYTATDYHCWGDTEFGPTGPIESGILLMDAGYRHTCAIRGDGRAECWGYTGNGAVFPP